MFAWWHLYDKHTDHKTHQYFYKHKTGMKSNKTVKQSVYYTYNCYKYWQMSQNIIPHLCCHTLFHAGDIVC